MYLLVFIQNLLVHLAEKILLIQPLTFGGDYPARQLTDPFDKGTFPLPPNAFPNKHAGGVVAEWSKAHPC